MIEPIFENEFEDPSDGFRPGRGYKDALRQVDALLTEGYTHVVDADLQGYFDSIPQEGLMDRAVQHISGGRLLTLLKGWLQQDIVQHMRTPRHQPMQTKAIKPTLLASATCRRCHHVIVLKNPRALGWQQHVQ